jgi:hypothetical protein
MNARDKPPPARVAKPREHANRCLEVEMPPPVVTEQTRTDVISLDLAVAIGYGSARTMPATTT